MIPLYSYLGMGQNELQLANVLNLYNLSVIYSCLLFRQYCARLA